MLTDKLELDYHYLITIAATDDGLTQNWLDWMEQCIETAKQVITNDTVMGLWHEGGGISIFEFNGPAHRWKADGLALMARAACAMCWADVFELVTGYKCGPSQRHLWMAQLEDEDFFA